MNGPRSISRGVLKSEASLSAMTGESKRALAPKKRERAHHLSEIPEREPSERLGNELGVLLTLQNGDTLSIRQAKTRSAETSNGAAAAG